MTFSTQAEVINECGKVKKIVFKGSLLYILWNDGTASAYQYNWIKNINAKMIPK